MNGNKPYDFPVGKLNNKRSVDNSHTYPQVIKTKTTTYLRDFYKKVHILKGRR